MAQSSFPFEGIDTTETQFSQMFRTFQDSVNGTYGGTELQVSAGTGLAVDVALGQAMVRGHFYVSTATESLSLTVADATHPRLDRVVLRLDPVANSIVLAVKAGTPAAVPVAPTLVQTDAGVWEMALATVLVPATAGVPSTITDQRTFMGSRISLWSDDTRPTGAFPYVGFNTTAGTFEGYDPVLATWGPIGGGGGGVTVADTPPADPDDGALWWDSANGELYLYYNDGTSSQWVAAAGPSVTVQSTAPTGYEGQLWLDDTDGSMYVYYTDPGGGSSSWIGAVSRSGGILQVVSTTKTDTFSASVATGATTSITGLSATITPSSATSKILCTLHVSASNGGASTKSVGVILKRDGSVIGAGDSVGTRTPTMFTSGLSGGGGVPSSGSTFLDSPTTTSSVTYSVDILQISGTTETLHINKAPVDGDDPLYARPISTITLMEVAG